MCSLYRGNAGAVALLAYSRVARLRMSQPHQLGSIAGALAACAGADGGEDGADEDEGEDDFEEDGDEEEEDEYEDPDEKPQALPDPFGDLFVGDGRDEVRSRDGARPQGGYKKRTQGRRQ